MNTPVHPAPIQTPKAVLYLLVGVNVLIAFAPIHAKNPMYDWHQLLIQGMPVDVASWLSERSLHVVLQLLWLLVFIPSGITLVAMPLKWRDPRFQLKLAYQMGLFVALIFSLQLMRYAR
jgi:hypothetical protein